MINLREEDKRVTPSEVPRVLVKTLPESRPIECQTCRQGHRFCEKPGGTVRTLIKADMSGMSMSNAVAGE